MTTVKAPLDAPDDFVAARVPAERHGCRQPRRRDRRGALRAGSDRAVASTSRPSSACGSTASTWTSPTTARRPTSRATMAWCRRAWASIYKPIEPRLHLRQLQPVLPAARRRAAVVAVADEPGARSRGVPQLRGRREVGRRPGVLAFTAALYRLDREQRRRARSGRSDAVPPRRCAAHRRGSSSG